MPAIDDDEALKLGREALAKEMEDKALERGRAILKERAQQKARKEKEEFDLQFWRCVGTVDKPEDLKKMLDRIVSHVSCRRVTAETSKL